MDDQLKARVVEVNRLTRTITEVVVYAPYQARKFEPGQFYRLQNFDVNAPVVKGFRMSMEGVALTGAWVDKEKGLLSLIILEMGGSSDLCAYLQPGEEVVCMGPTGTPTLIPSNANVVLLGGGLGNAVLFSIAKACKEAGSKVLYFAGYKHGEDLFKRDEVEAATDQVIFSTDMGSFIEPRRPQDAHIRANIVQAMIAYSKGEFGEKLFPLQEAKSPRRHWFRSDDGCGKGRAPRPFSTATSSWGTCRYRLHQLPHAVHDEKGLRPVPTAARGSGDG